MEVFLLVVMDRSLESRRLPLAMLLKGGTQARDIALRVEGDGGDVERAREEETVPVVAS